MPDVQALKAARCLALDALAVRSVGLLTRHGIPSLLLKGPATVHRLYADAPGRRNYTDVDLLVPPARWADAARVLAGSGMRDQAAGMRASELEWRYERNLFAPSGLKLDLHRGFYGVRDRDALWRELHATRTTLPLAGSTVEVPGAAGAALLYALHAAQNGGQPQQSGKPLLDLRRAVEQLDADVWTAAAELARRVGALDAFAVGLGLVAPEHEALRAADGVPRRPEVVRRATRPLRQGDLAAVAVTGATGWRPRLRTVRDRLLPSPAALRALLGPVDRRALAVAYVRRLASLVVVAPRAWWRLRHDEPGTPRRRRELRPLARSLSHPDRTRIATAVWTLRALRSTRAQLRTTPPPRVSLPAPSGCGPDDLRRRRTAAVRRLLRLARATCLEECVVAQRWLASAGERRDLVVGVKGPSAGFAAHAWLEGDRTTPDFVELTRYAA